MSTGEKDVIIGRAVREEQELRQNLGIIDKEISDLCVWLNRFVKDIKDRTLQFQPRTESLRVPDELTRYADLSRVVDLVQQRIDSHKKLEQANEELIRIGVRPASIKVGY